MQELSNMSALCGDRLMFWAGGSLSLALVLLVALSFAGTTILVNEVLYL